MKADLETKRTLIQLNDTNYVYLSLRVFLWYFGGAILHIFISVAKFRSSNLRKEYLTPYFVPIAISCFLFSLFPVLVIELGFRTGCQLTVFAGYELLLCSGLNRVGITLLRCITVYFPRKAGDKSFQCACKSIPIMGWTLTIPFVRPTRFGQYGRLGLECKTFICKHVNMHLEDSSIKPDPALLYFISFFDKSNYNSFS